MSILSEILNEEYKRLTDTLSSFEALVAGLPKGSIREKKINGKEYSYLQWRDGRKVRSKYIKQEEKVSLSEQIERRRQYEKEIKTLRETKKEFSRIIGRDL
jgi:hypothetical protein